MADNIDDVLKSFENKQVTNEKKMRCEMFHQKPEDEIP